MRVLILTFAACAALAGSPPPAARAVESAAPIQVRVDADDWNAQTPAQIQDRIETKHPAAYFVLARKLFVGPKKDDAVFWFYVGQIRYRAYIAIHKNLDPTGDPALFSSLFEVVGRPINEYAFGDIPALIATIDRALAWDDAHDDTFTPKGEARAAVRDGLVKLKAQIVATADSIRAERAKRGLKNRTP